MVETKGSYVLTTCFLSGAAGIISFVSLLTQGWVFCDGRFISQDSDSRDSDFNYGLFGGTYNQRYGEIGSADISMTCSYSHNICALLCGKDSDRMSDLLEQLYNGKKTDWAFGECPNTKSFTSVRGVYGINLTLSGNDLQDSSDRKFINCYAHLFTIIFLVFSGIAGLFSAGMSVWNTASNPIEIYFNIWGLYLYNFIAFCSLLISVLIWGIMFISTLADYPSFIATVNGTMNPTGVSLGWSYWINIGSLLLYAGSICTLYLRSYLISKEPQFKVEIEENTPAGILLF